MGVQEWKQRRARCGTTIMARAPARLLRLSSWIALRRCACWPLWATGAWCSANSPNTPPPTPTKTSRRRGGSEPSPGQRSFPSSASDPNHRRSRMLRRAGSVPGMATSPSCAHRTPTLSPTSTKTATTDPTAWTPGSESCTGQARSTLPRRTVSCPADADRLIRGPRNHNVD